MDSALDCGYFGSQAIKGGQSVTVNAKEKDTSSSSSQLGCTINFFTVDNDTTIRVDFVSFSINTCTVNLYLSGDGSGSMSSYSCGDNPSTYFSVGRIVTLTLHRISVSYNQYDFQLKVTAVRGNRHPGYQLPSDKASSCCRTSDTYHWIYFWSHIFCIVYWNMLLSKVLSLAPAICF
ncbi:uncharacterized protein LOC123539382 isoform X2 [Mercenaria mercenaria]|nr:uncharacterized protein LOC123539382 isoform X2 [Mercenaria mercenaria]XP_053386369.1 uncharacterized protein LOC123539382 isoform X2 [Mercenaria mercenaria]